MYYYFTILQAFCFIYLKITNSLILKVRTIKMKKQPVPRNTNLKNEICTVALRLFCERGYSATNMSDVSEALQITRTPLYYYYKDKKNLYIEVIKKHLSTKREIYTEMAAESLDIFSWLRQHIEYACSNKSDSVLYNAFDMEEFHFLSDLNDETNHYIYALKRRRVLRAIENGELPADTNVELFLTDVYTLNYGLIYMMNHSIHSKDLKMSPKKVEALIDLIVRQIKAVFGFPPVADK